MSSVEFELTEGERSHPLWARLKGHLQTKLGELRRKNDDTSLDAVGTALLRGQIKCLNNLIALGDVRPDVEPDRDYGSTRR